MTQKGDIFLVCGSGGVGKTTVSAALGLKYAKAGYKTIVLTIDPAKRLATSLGIESLGDEPKHIGLDDFNASGELWAMMLDTKRTFDRIVEKYASTTEAKNKIYNNKLYQHMSQMLAGTQEYMAMERLHEIHAQKKYDIIIIDTPPMQNAMDFLAAPQKMMNMINNSMLHLLLKPTVALGKSGLKFIEKSSQQILKIFDRITGFAFMQDISEMLIAFKDLLAGFQTRSEEVAELLKNAQSQFILVCTAHEHSIVEAIDFSNLLSEKKYHLKYVVVNRVYSGPPVLPEKIANMQKKLGDIFDKTDANRLVDNYLNYVPLMRRDNDSIKMLTKHHLPKLTIPLFLSDIHDLKGLNKIADQIALEQNP